MPTYRVTQVVKNYQVFYVEAKTWQEAKALVDAGEIEIDHTDVGDEIAVISVDSQDGTKTYYEI